jgi:nucleoside-diphosphate-sugar epimerase
VSPALHPLPLSVRLALMTGASGALGTPLLDALRERGWTTRALVRRRPVPGADESVAGDLGDALSLGRAADGADAVVHLAATTHARSARTYEEVNVEGTKRLLEASERAGVRRFLFVSTRAISEGGGAYSRSKREAEAAVAAAGVEHVIVRLPEVYGTGSEEGVDRILALARRGERIPIVGDGSHELCPVFVADAVPALAAALEAPAAAGKTYTLAGECLSVRDFAAACVGAFASPSRILSVPVPLVAVLGAASRVVPLPVYPDQLARLRAPKPAPSREAGDDLGFAPRPLRDGLRAVEES